MKKKLLILLFGLFAAIAIERLCHRATDGFQLVHIYSPVNYTISHKCCSDEIRSLLQAEKFHYLTKGAQNYVFASSDGRYILKLFKFNHHSLPSFLQFLPLPDFLERIREQKSKHKSEEMGALFQSYKIAFEEMPHESALFALHLSKTSDLNTKISLVDRLNIEHQVDADQCEFVLQKRADLVIPTLERLREKGDLEGAKGALASLLSLVKTVCAKGISNSDQHLSRNFGFIEGKPVVIDCGNLRKKRGNQQDPPLKDGALKVWLAKKWPELFYHFDEMEKLISPLNSPMISEP